MAPTAPPTDRHHRCNRFPRPLRMFIAKLWIADLKFLFGADSTRALEYEIECVRQDKRKKDYRLTGRYHAIEQGRHFPDDARIQRAVALCPLAARVLELPLWDLFDDQRELTLEKLDELLLKLSPDVQDILFHPSLYRPHGLPAHRSVTREDVLQPLAHLGSIDAFTACLVLLRKGRLAWRDPVFCRRAMYYAVATFHRLTAFTPFYLLHHDLFYYLQLFINREVEMLIGFNWYRGRRADQLRRFLTALRELGLTGPTFSEQMNYVVGYWSKGVQDQNDKEVNEMLQAADTIRMGIHALGKPIRVLPTDPFYVLLRRIEHPAVRSGRPITLPRKRPKGPDDDIVISHAFGTARCLVTPELPSTPRQPRTSKVRKPRPGRQRQQN